MRRLLLSAATMCSLLALGATPALAQSPWRLDSSAAPTNLPPGEEARIIATATNLGQENVIGSGAHPIVISDALPAGLKVPAGLSGAEIVGKLEAKGIAETIELKCSLEEMQRREVSCTTLNTTQSVRPYQELNLVIPVEVAAGASTGEQNTVSLTGGEDPAGGEVPGASLAQKITISAAETPFGVQKYELTPENEDGSTDIQAGSHPFQLTTTLDFNERLGMNAGEHTLVQLAPALPRNLSFALPPGLLGDPQAVSQCSDANFSSIGEEDINACPRTTVVGVAVVTLNLAVDGGVFTQAVPVFNLVPAPGEPARFGFEDAKVPVILDTSVRTDGDYGVNVSINNATQVGQLLNTRVTLWGQPDVKSHDNSRGWACIDGITVGGETCEALGEGERSTIPFLTLPTSCTGPLSTQMSGEAWTGESLFSQFTFEKALGQPLERLEGCEAVPFSPSISVSPVDEGEGQAPGAPVSTASTPTGMNVSVQLPQEAEGLGEGAVKDTTVTLPQGVQLDPSAANGLQACSESQVGFEGQASGPDPFYPGAPEPLRFSTAPAQCPPASKVGTVHISSPDLAHELEGGVFIATQDANPFGSLFALYIVAEDPVSRLLVKLAGEVTLDEQTGQVTTTFANTPQVPFAKLGLHLFEGPHASLSTPPLCGSYQTTSSFAAWAGAIQDPISEPFAITSGPGGEPCSYPQPFTPSFQAGSINTQAGAFTPFTLTIGRPDGDQALGSVTVHLPTGIAALLSAVKPCPEPQASQQSCGAESLIGHSTAISGLGSEPISLSGAVYLTGPYKGAPFGLEVITPAVAGPFNLGNVVVRSTINVDAHTAAVTITSDPIPTILKGVPAQIKQLNVTIDRQGFEFNPTNCNPMAITGTLSGAEGGAEAVASPFQVVNCGALPFKPKLTASTHGQASKANGANFAVTVRSGGLGQANIAKVLLQLPKALPARLTTLQKACTEGAFAANPASCPEGSVIGTATIHTPVLSSPLAGPAYLVSHGGAAFPDVEFVLQGEGITLVLDGKTQIKNQLTYSKFESAPDAPFTVFETVLPAGPHSALTTNLPEKAKFNLCSSSLSMPTEIVGQNGAVIKQSTKIALQGCKTVKSSRPKKLTRAQLLRRTLTACRKQHKHSKARRVACEKRVRKRYAARKSTYKAKRTANHTERL